jgi:EAL and modified HD-GYP domain-containing signal transduction protein
MSGAVLDWVIAGRQSIHDSDRAVVGYELRFTAQDATNADLFAIQGTGASSADVVFGALNIGLDRLVGDKLIFIHSNRELLTGDTPLSLPAERTVIGAAPGVELDEAVIAGCQRLRRAGFQVCFDASVWFANADRLRDVASVVRVDSGLLSGVERDELVDRAKAVGVRLWADKLETEADLTEYLTLGFDLYQGFALEQPTLESSRVVGASEVARLRLATQMLHDPLDYAELEDILRTEPGMTYQLLQLASLGRLGETRREVKSLHQALVLAGDWRIQGWIALLLARPAGASAGDAVTTALTRARACELLAKRVGLEHQVGFAAGLVSSFERMLQIPRDELARSLPISDELRDAAFGDQTPLARIVCDVADRQAARQQPRMLSGLGAEELDAALASAFSWAMQATTVMDQS